jgi:UrcA family protein
MNRTALALFAALALSATTATVAAPSTAVIVRHESVRVTGSDVASIAGARQLYGRLQSAARRVCGPAARDLREHADRSRCIRIAVANAVADVGSPLLAAVHAGHESTHVAAERVASAH